MKMFKRWLQKLENPEIPLLGPNVLALQFWCLLKPRNGLKKYIYIFVNVYLYIFCITQCVDIWFVRSDLNILLNNMKLSTLSNITALKAIIFLIWQDRWKSVMDYVTAADLKQRKSNDDVKKNIIDGYTKYCRILTYFFGGLMYTTIFIIILTPCLKYWLSPVYRENVKNGTEPYLEVVNSWVPFDKSTVPGYLAASAIQSCAALFGGGWVTALDTTAISIMVFFRGESEMLRRDCKFIFGTETQKLNDEEVMERIKDCRKRHLELLKFARLLDSCLSPIMLLYVFVCSVMLCVTAYQITLETSATQRLLTAEYLIFGIAQLFMYCWHSNDVLYTSNDLTLGPYENTWWASDVRLRKNLYILTAQFRQTVVFTAGPFTRLTIPTFITIIKGAYTYYTLLSKSQMK